MTQFRSKEQQHGVCHACGAPTKYPWKKICDPCWDIEFERILESCRTHRRERSQRAAEFAKAFPGIVAGAARHEAAEGDTYQRDIEKLVEDDGRA